MNGMSLCAGIGGLDLGLHLACDGYRTICYVEKEAYCQDILFARMADGLLDRGPLWDDLITFDARQWKGLVDIVHGGYPCQPFSVAGKRRGAADQRHLWPDIARIVRECEPEWCFFENVAGHLTLGFDVVARDLEAMGYRVAAGLFTAAEVGAPHRRQRLYILARRQQGDSVADAGRIGEHADEPRRSGGPSRATAPVLGGSGATVGDPELARRTETGSGHPLDARPEPQSGCSAVGHTDDVGLERRREPEREGSDEWAAWPPGPEERDRWAGITDDLKPAVRRVVDGIPHRVDRLKALGNAVVPDVAALAWRVLSAGL